MNPVTQTETEPSMAMNPASETVNVALLGYGTVGSSLHKLLLEHRDHVRHTTGRTVDVTVALVRDASRTRDTHAHKNNNFRFVDDMTAVLDSDVHLVAEAMGGIEPAREYVLAALERGIPVVTANKQLIARHGPELFATAERYGAQLRFEASVCGAIPIIKMLRESLAASRVDRLLGILNGTTNYILSAMTEHGSSFNAALGEAQKLGYAEPDPTDDVEGVDAAAKLAILAGIAFHTGVTIDSIRVKGITGVDAEDIACADSLDYRIKLIGRAERRDATVIADVSPMLIAKGHALATVAGALNAVYVSGSTFDELMIQGPGAGGPQTASALAGDIVSAMGSAPSFLTRDPNTGPIPIGSPDLRQERFYVRMQVPDRPGVLATVAQSFAKHEISIERVIQQRSENDTATLVITSHPTTAGAIAAATANNDGDEWQTTVMPILDL